MDNFTALTFEYNRKVISSDTFDEILNNKGVTCSYICTTDKGRTFNIYGEKHEQFKVTVK